MRFLKYALLAMALIAPAIAYADGLEYGYTMPYINIDGPNQMDGVSVNPNTGAPGNFTSLTVTSTATLSGSVSSSGLTNITGPVQLNSIDDSQPPGGRLSLSSTLAVPTADVTAATTIYYLPYFSLFVPIYNGTHWNTYSITSSGISIGLGSTNMPSSQVYDIYVSNQSGTPTLCSMYWGSNTSRSSSAGGKSGTGDARISNLNGIWVNKTAIVATDCFGGASGTTGVAFGANQGTLLGTYYTSANGQTQVQCNPTPGSGGAAIGVYLSNAYNRVPLFCSNSDTATAQTSASASWAKLGTNDTAAFVDGLQISPFAYDAHVVAGNGTAAGDCGSFGVAAAGSGTTAPTVLATTCAPTATLADNYNTLAVHQGFYPILGLSPTLFAEKQSATGTTTYMPTTTQENFTVSIQY
jgi:hypothetical protein